VPRKKPEQKTGSFPELFPELFAVLAPGRFLEKFQEKLWILGSGFWCRDVVTYWVLKHLYFSYIELMLVL